MPRLHRFDRLKQHKRSWHSTREGDQSTEPCDEETEYPFRDRGEDLEASKSIESETEDEEGLPRGMELDVHDNEVYGIASRVADSMPRIRRLTFYIHTSKIPYYEDLPTRIVSLTLKVVTISNWHIYLIASRLRCLQILRIMTPVTDHLPVVTNMALQSLHHNCPALEVLVIPFTFPNVLWEWQTCEPLPKLWKLVLETAWFRREEDIEGSLRSLAKCCPALMSLDIFNIHVNGRPEPWISRKLILGFFEFLEEEEVEHMLSIMV